MKRIPLAGIAGKGLHALVDDCDFPVVSRFEWAISRHGDLRYAITNGVPSVSMHRLVMGCLGKPSKVVDHVNGDGLDNRRENLRFCTHSQNYYNARKRSNTSSKYKGVSIHKPTGRWRAQLSYKAGDEKIRIDLGLHGDEASAAKAYDAGAREYFKEFARLNFPGTGERSALTRELNKIL